MKNDKNDDGDAGTVNKVMTFGVVKVGGDDIRGDEGGQAGQGC